MSESFLFTWLHFEADIILNVVSRYLRYALRDCAVDYCFELRTIFQHPAVDDGAVDRDHALLHHLFELVVA
jgi:hypothetical protein